MTIKDEDLRQNRLIFYEKHMDETQNICTMFLEKSKSKAAMLVDREGHLISITGETDVDAETISALVAASYAATAQIAKLLGEEEFSVLFHQGKKDSIQFSLVGERMLLVVVFDRETTVGMVRLYADRAVQKLSALLDQMQEEALTAPPPTMEAGFAEAADESLDNLFGDD